MRPRSTNGLVAVTIGALLSLTAACGQPPTTAPPGPSGPSIAPGPPGAPAPGSPDPQTAQADRWATGYCGAVGQVVRSLAEMPSIDPSTPEKTSTSASGLLGVLVDGLDRALSSLDAIGPAPGNPGDSIRQDIIGQLGKIRGQAVDVKTRIETSPPASAENRAALGDARAPLDRIGDTKLLGGLDAVPELANASQAVGECQQLTTESTAPVG